ncbi:MAG: prephenate dehydrogenase/arogenate dehydrogenase family protein [Verrucomicrobiae bacterium]|nr:prephenate dehydrogenase/arogenate dehydrogenase family protein [Verrucomicrobiae bacterium]
MRFRKVTIIGVGLLGGSIGLALRRRKLAGEIAGYVRREASIAECERAGATDYATTDLLAAVSGADLIVLCTPLAQMKSLTQQMLPALKRGAIVTDVGSVKTSVVRDVEVLLHQAGAYFVGSHPMAGSEKQGVLAARADLFADAICVLTPTRKTHPAALRKVETLWKNLGARLLRTTPEAHDALVSRSSHLPHLLAATLTNLVLNPKLPKEQVKLCATGFRDTTRIASGSPEMWRDIVLANREQLRLTLDSFVRELQAVQGLLRKKRKHADEILGLFQTAKTRRDNWCACGASPSQE